MTGAGFAGFLVSAAVAGLQLEAPSDWDKVAPSSGMRAAEWTLAAVAGDPEEARVIVFYFGKGGGGGGEANLERWYGQFKKPDGSPARGQAVVRKVDAGRLTITRADIAGTYVAEVRPGAGERHHKPDFRMIAAIVEGGEGPWYIRLLGPKATVAKWEKSFDGFLDSLRPAS
jgi:hypothetical protein